MKTRISGYGQAKRMASQPASGVGILDRQIVVG